MTPRIAKLLPSDGRAAVMGILNITPDSFSDGGTFYRESRIDARQLMAKATQMAEAGVHIFDVGGESTRPGAVPVTTGEELVRVIPVIRLLKEQFDIPVSVDTSNPQVMATAIDEGADLINDVRALMRPSTMDIVAKSGLPVCLMHMPAEPGVMQNNPQYQDVEKAVMDFLLKRVQCCIDAGIDRENIILDPGFGFGKTLAHNLTLFRALPRLAAEGYPLLVGVSRKRMLGDITNKGSDGRMAGSVAMALLAAQRGARILRVHDVPETIDALNVYYTVEGIIS